MNNTLLTEFTKHESKFLRSLEGNGEKNEHGVYVYESANGKHLIDLMFFLRHYRQWLVEQGIVKEIE